MPAPLIPPLTSEDFDSTSPKEEDRISDDDYDDDDNGNGHDNGDDGNDHDHNNG